MLELGIVFVLPSIKYWNQVEGDKTCTIGDYQITIGGIKTGVEKSGKQVDSQIVFFADRTKVVCHLYNTTCLILVNGQGYQKLIEKFLVPFFQAKINSCNREIESYNEIVLEKLGPTRVKRSDIKYKGGSTFPCNRCDYTGKNISTLNKHKKVEHSLSFNASKPVIGPRQSTRNNSVIESMMLENLTSTELDNDKNNLDENTLKYTCTDCNLITTSKERMDKHVGEKHVQNENEEVKFSYTKCKHDFVEVEDFNSHVKTHENVPEQHTTSATIEPVEGSDDLTLIENVVYLDILESFVSNLTTSYQESSSPETQEENSPDVEEKHPCDKCMYVARNNEWLNTHKMNKHGPRPSSTPDFDRLVELTCRQCVFEAESIDEIDKHKDVFHKKTQSLPCNLCDYRSATKEDVDIHIQTMHMATKVNIIAMPNEKQKTISCPQCDYTCKLNIQLRNHTKKQHTESEDKKFKCTQCTFQSDFLVKMFEHKLEKHPEGPMDSNPNKTTVKEMVLNLLADQGMEILEEFQDFKKNLKDAFEHFTEGIKDNMIE